MKLRLTILTTAIYAVALTGCASNYQGVEIGPPESGDIGTDKATYSTSTISGIIDTISDIQNERELSHWQKKNERDSNSVSQYSGAVSDWVSGLFTSDVKQGDYRFLSEDEAYVKSYYQSAVRIQSLMEPTPAKVVVNDDLMLISMPNDWAWNNSYSSLSIPAERYLEKLVTHLRNADMSTAVRTYSSSDVIYQNRQALAQARAKTMAEHLARSLGKVDYFAFGNKFIEGELLDDSTVLELRPREEVSSSEFVKDKAINSFQW